MGSAYVLIKLSPFIRFEFGAFWKMTKYGNKIKFRKNIIVCLLSIILLYLFFHLFILKLKKYNLIIMSFDVNKAQSD